MWGFCILVYLPHCTPPFQTISAPEAFDDDICTALILQMHSCTLTHPIRPCSRQSSAHVEVGLSMRSLSRHSPVVSGLLWLWSHDPRSPDTCNSLVPSSKAVSTKEIFTFPILQKELCNKIDNHLFTIYYLRTAYRARHLSVY